MFLGRAAAGLAGLSLFRKDLASPVIFLLPPPPPPVRRCTAAAHPQRDDVGVARRQALVQHLPRGRLAVQHVPLQELDRHLRKTNKCCTDGDGASRGGHMPRSRCDAPRVAPPHRDVAAGRTASAASCQGFSDWATTPHKSARADSLRAGQHYRAASQGNAPEDKFLDWITTRSVPSRTCSPVSASTASCTKLWSPLRMTAQARSATPPHSHLDARHQRRATSGVLPAGRTHAGSDVGATRVAFRRLCSSETLLRCPHTTSKPADVVHLAVARVAVQRLLIEVRGVWPLN